MKPTILNKDKQEIILCCDDISDELYLALHEAFSKVLEDNDIDPTEVCFDKWNLIATYY